MKTLIVYATTHGCTENIANRIAKGIETDYIYNCKNETPDLKEFERVILGGSIIAGSVNSKLKKWVKKNRSELLNRRLHIFLSAGEDNPDYITNSFSEDLLTHASDTIFVGGEYYADRSKGFMKFIMKMAGKEADFSHLKEDVIKEFISNLGASND